MSQRRTRSFKKNISSKRKPEQRHLTFLTVTIVGYYAQQTQAFYRYCSRRGNMALTAAGCRLWEKGEILRITDVAFAFGLHFQNATTFRVSSYDNLC